MDDYAIALLWVLGIIFPLFFFIFLVSICDEVVADNEAPQIPVTNAAAPAPRVQNNNTNTINIVIHAPPRPPPPPRQLPRQVEGNLIRCLVYDKYRRKVESSSGGECAICLVGYDDGVLRATTIACKHRFHAFCIEAWLMEHTSCPICRHSLHKFSSS